MTNNKSPNRRRPTTTHTASTRRSQQQTAPRHGTRAPARKTDIKNSASSMAQTKNTQSRKMRTIGEMDFTSFMTSGTEVKSAVRTVYDLNVLSNGTKVEIYIRANGYLYNMVRIITGTLTDVGMLKYPPERIKEIICAKDRSKAGPTAPPQGLSLYRVEY